MNETAYFALGCFWGAERRFWQTEGVLETSVGYMGGEVANPSYELVCTGKTNHAETVEVQFNPEEITYHELLAEFFMMHDPTSLNRQGNDYAGGIAVNSIKTINGASLNGRITTTGLQQQQTLIYLWQALVCIQVLVVSSTHKTPTVFVTICLTQFTINA
mgnify:CR=1 FL=1